MCSHGPRANPGGHSKVRFGLSCLNFVGGIARMSDPALIAEIQNAVSIPVMAKVRIGHFVEAQV